LIAEDGTTQVFVTADDRTDSITSSTQTAPLQACPTSLLSGEKARMEQRIRAQDLPTNELEAELSKAQENIKGLEECLYVS
jgi:hypothetical protein